MQLADELRGAGYTGDAQHTIGTYGAAYVRETLRLALKAERAESRSAKPIRNVGGLIAHLLKSGAAQESAAAKQDERRPKDLSAKEIDKLANQLRQAFDFARSEQSHAVWEALDEDDQGAVHDVMRVELNDFTLTQLDKQGWRGASYETLRTGVLFTHRAELFAPYLFTLEAFTQEQNLFSEFKKEDKARILSRAEDL